MATLDQLRALFPDAESDADVIRRASKDFGIDPSEIASEIGYKVPKGGLTSQQFSSSIDRYQAGLYGVGEEVAKGVGLTGVSKYLRGNRQENELQADIASERARELGAVDEFKNVHGISDFGSYAKGLAIQSVPYAAEALVGGLAARGAMTGTRAALSAAELAGDTAAVAKAKRALNIGSEVGGVAASYPSAVGDVLSNQREQSGETRGGVAAALAVPYAALNAVGVESALMRGNLFKNSVNLLDKGTGLKGAAARTAATATGVGLKEGASETGQEMLNQIGRMSVDKNEQFFSDAAQERFKESFIGGATLGGVAGGALGGWRRSGNDVSQAIASDDQSKPPLTTQQFTPPAPLPPAPSAGIMAGLTGRGADPLAGRSKLIGGELPPAVTGGSTDIAVAQQQAQAESQKIQQAQAQQAAREQAMQDFGITTDPAAKQGQFLGKPLFGPSVNAVADAVVPLDKAMEPHQRDITKAIIQANSETGNKLVSFTFNANNPQASVQKGFEAVAKTANKFQIAHVQSVEEAAAILDEQSKTAKKNELEQINAIHQALTGEDTSGYIASQQSEVAKGAKNGKLQLQNNAGVRKVPVQGGARETSNGGTGPVRPAQVQPIGTAGLGEGSLGLQAGQLSAEGIRAGANGSAVANDVGQPTQNTQVSGAQNAATQGTTGQQQAAVSSTAQNATERQANEYTGAIPSELQAQSDEEQRVQEVPNLIRNALRMIYKSDRKVELLLYLTEEGNRGNYGELAKEYGVTEQYVKELASDAITDKGEAHPRFITKNIDKFLDAVNYQAETMNVSLLEALDGLQAIREAYAENATNGALSATVDEGDLINTGMEIQNVKERVDNQGKGTGKIDRTNVSDLAEEGNKMEALMQQYLDLSNELEAANEANDGRVEDLEKQVAELTAKIADAEKKEKARVRATAGKQAPKETENAVQVESTDEGNVRQPAGSGEEVGKANAEPQKPARARKAKVEVKPAEEAKQEVKTPEEQWSVLAEQFPGMPPYEGLTKDEKIRWDDVASRGVANLAAANKIITTTVKTGPTGATKAITDESMIVDGTGLVRDITSEQRQLLEGPLKQLTDPQTDRLEKHYGAKRGTAEFFTKLHEDVTKYAAKGAEAVSAAIRDIIKAVYTGLLATAVVFNPTYMNQAEAYVYHAPQAYSITKEVRAEAPAAAAAKMSNAAKEAYATLVPALKADLVKRNKLFIMADKPSGRIFVFTPDGKLILEKKSLFGLAKGDFYKGNNDLPANRITPAGLHNIVMVDAAKGGAAAKTAGEYDFGKVFGIVDENPGVLTIMHSVWLKETDAAKRSAALKNENAADSRYSFGCINVDKATYKSLLDEHGEQMDGAKLFIVPDNQERLQEFVSGKVAQNLTGEDKLVRQSVKPVTETTTGVRQNAEQTTNIDRTQIGKEEEGRLASKSKSFYDVEDLAADFDGVDAANKQLEDMGIGHAMDYVSDWETINDTAEDAINGEIVSQGGRYKVVLNQAKLTSSDHAIETVTHEVGHAVDMAPHGGIYSGQPEMSVVVKDGKITPVGVVAREMYNLYNTNAGWNDYLEYPFNTSKFKEINNHVVVEGELFAQLFSVYVNPKGRAKLEKVAPQTAAFMAEVIKHVQSTKSLQIQTATTSAQRTLAFRNRNTSGGGQARINPIQRRRETERLASRSASFSQGLNTYLPPAAVKPAKSVVTNIVTAARNGLLSAAITEDVVNMAGKYMRSAKDYLDAQYARQKTRLEFEMRIERILENFDKLPKNLQGTGADSVNRYILDSTMKRKWGYYPGEDRVGTELFEADQDLAARFDAFPDDAQQIIKDVFDHGYTALELKKNAVSKAVEREFAERERAAIGDADALEQLQKERKEMVSRLTRLQNIDFTVPYAYLGRYGDYIVVAKSKEFKHWEERAKLNDFDVKRAKAWLDDHVSSPDHYVVQFAETQGEADQLASELIATGKFDMDGTEAGPKEAAASYIGDDLHLAVSRARNLANRQKGEGSEELDRLLGDLYLLTAAENSARKSEIARKYVYGANENMMRNLATSGRADAHFLSTMEHNDEITGSLEKMREEARRNYKEAMPLYNELYTRQSNSMDYKQPALLSRALTQATSLWFLSTSPAFYLQQILQTGVLSLPYMAGRLGYFRSARAIKAAYSDIGALVKGLGVTDHVDFSKAPADVRGMLQTLVGMGKIDISIDSDAKARAGEQGTLGKVVRKLQGVNNRIETINRATAAIAAYRGYLQRYGANNTEAATKFAAEVVSNSHGSYDGFNTPRVLTSDVGRVVGQFKRFQIIQLSMLAKLIHTSFKGASAEEKIVARRALAFITGHMAVLGGALGVPFVMQIGNLLVKLFGDEDEPDDLEYKLRQAIGDKTLADLLLNGVPAAMGVNLGGKLGMGNVASILPFTDVDLSSRSGYEKVMVGMMGPFFGGLAPKFIDGAGMIGKGEYYKGLELLMPNGIGNAMKGVRYANEGITMRNGDVVMKPEDISIVDAAFQAVGLPTTAITNRQYTQNVKAEFDKFYADKATEIKGAYVDASRDGDSGAMADARKDWEDLQASRRKNGYKIQPMSELFMAVSAAGKRQRSVVNGVETSKSNKQFVANII